MKKILLCGYDWAGCKALELLNKNKNQIYVYTHPDRPHDPSLWQYASELKIPYTFEKVQEANLPFKPDLICSVYYRYIIEEAVIAKCKGKIFNLHPSLLPMYRGASSITNALINGDKKIGYTFHYIDKNIDTGKIIFQDALEVSDYETQLNIYQKVMFTAMQHFNEVVDQVIDGFIGIEQLGKSSYYNRGVPNEGQINPMWNKEKVKNYIRAMKHPPYKLAQFNDQEISNIEEFNSLYNKSKKK